jgi:hypothetical protein
VCDTHLSTRSTRMLHAVRNKAVGALLVAADDEESAVEPQQREAVAAGAAGPDLTTAAMLLQIQRSVRYAH